MKKTTEESTALVPLDPQSLMQQAIESGAGIETLERLLALRREVRAEQAKESWYAAMSQFQQTCPAIRRTETARISTRTGGSYSYSYAPLGEIMRVIQPVMGPLGLSVSFRVRYEKEHVIASARVSHELGHHEESGEVAMPVVNDGAGANPAQRVGIASTYAKRYALLAIIGLSPEDDPDVSDRPGKAEPRTQPQRASRAKAGPEKKQPKAGQWDGIVKSVESKRVEIAGEQVLAHRITGANGIEFRTVNQGHADLAREAGKLAVTIRFVEGKNGVLIVQSIEPFVDQDPLPGE